MDAVNFRTSLFTTLLTLPVAAYTQSMKIELRFHAAWRQG